MMTTHREHSASPDAAARLEDSPGGQLEPLEPAMFSRVMEPDSDGQVYDIEILMRPPGLSDNEDAHRLAACTLRIGAPIDKNRQRVLDGKIENLWLKDEGTANRLDDVRILATLLGYVRDFCAGIEVPHISSIQKFDHPAWLRDLFTVSGFNRCGCLKPEAGTQRYRACLKLNVSDHAVLQGIVPSTSTSDVKNVGDGAKAEQQQKEDCITGVAPSSHASAGMTVAEVSLPKQQKPSLNLPTVTEAMMEKQRTNGCLPKAAGIAPPENSQRGKGSLKTADSPANADCADQWLSRNQKILSPTTSSALNPTRPQPSPPRQTRSLDSAANTNCDPLAAETRKRNAKTAELNGNEDPKRNTRQRRDTTGSENELHIKHSAENHTSEQLSLSNAKCSFTAGDKTHKSKASEGHTGDSSITDTLLAQIDKGTAGTSPKQRIKKESTLSQPARSSPLEIRRQRSQDLPPKLLTCYYWKHQGGCNKRDRDCSYAHYDTGHDASAPNRWKSSRYRMPSYNGQYDGALDYYGNSNGIHIEKSHDGTKGASTPTGPRADVEGLPYDGSRIDSYRPRS